jgi:stearoyl-CoA desaturase (delta-9 desaturase)
MVLRPLSERLQYALYFAATTAAGVVPPLMLLALGHPPTRLDLALFLSLYTAGALGFSIGWHRMLAHDACRLRPVARAVVLAAASLTFQGKPSAFVYAHRLHHALADQPGDPHSPRGGLLHAHCGWFMRARPDADHVRSADGVVRFFDRTWIHWTALSYLIPAVLGGLLARPGELDLWAALTGLVWGGTFRIWFGCHALWLGGSLAHRVGRRTFDTPDDSRNSVFCSLLTFGDGWHNNHHAAPRAANLNARVWQLDGPGLVLKLLHSCGLVVSLSWYERADWDRRAERLRRVPKTSGAKGRGGGA